MFRRRPKVLSTYSYFVCFFLRDYLISGIDILGAPEITANLYCNFVYLYWEGSGIFIIYLRKYMARRV